MTELFTPPVAQAAEKALARFLLEHAEPLLNAAAHLGGRPAVRRTARLLEGMAAARRVSPRLRRELVGLHRLLTLQSVDDPESLEAGHFADIDPASPLVVEICRLSDGLRTRLKALAEAAAHHDLAEALAA